MVEDLWTGKPSAHVHVPFITQPVNNTERHVVFRVGRMCASIYVQVVDVATFFLTKFKRFYSTFMGRSFDMNTKEYTPLKWAYCLVDSQLLSSVQKS